MSWLKYYGVIVFLIPVCVYAQNDKTYREKLSAYRNGTRDYPAMALLAKDALTQKDTITAQSIADDYMKNYLSKMKDNELYTPENIVFIATFTNSPKDIYFNLFLKRTGLVNNTLGKITFAQDVVEKVLIRSEIEPALRKLPAGSQPDWKQLTNYLSNKYDPLSGQRAVIRAELSFYDGKDRMKFCRALVVYTSLYLDHTDTSLMDHNASYILKYSNDERDIKSALTWSEMTIQEEPNNLVYKKTHQAIEQKLENLEHKR
jgi:hypothetical protein